MIWVVLLEITAMIYGNKNVLTQTVLKTLIQHQADRQTNQGNAR